MTSLTWAGYWQVRHQARKALTIERADAIQNGVVPFTRRARQPLNTQSIKFLQNTGQTRAVARWNASFFIATNGGLLQLSEDGVVRQHFTVLDGLTESDLTTLAVFQDRLFIGTRSSGLLEFDGTHFASLQWSDRQAQAVTALLEHNGHLLVGTFAGGLLEFDGQHFRELRPERERTRLRGITLLAHNASRLYVGTFDNGLWLAEAGRWQHFTRAEGLLSERVVGVAEAGAQLYVATDFGLSALASEELSSPDPRLHPVLTRPALAGLAAVGGQLWLCQDDGHIASLDPSTQKGGAREIPWARPDNLNGAQLALNGGNLWLLSNAGLWRTSENGLPPFTPFGPVAREQTLTDNTISALALDSNGQLWAGSFRRGFDVLSGNRLLAHREAPEFQEVNALIPASTGGMYVAASQGVFHVPADFNPQAVTLSPPATAAQAHTSPLAVMNLAFVGEQLAIATNRGLAFGTPGQMKRLTTVQGLPGNSLYAVQPVKNSLYAATLGGLAQIQNGKVVRVFKDSNSALSNNWVSALCVTGERLFAGTYGGGLYELDAAGELRSVPGSAGLTVNPNALRADEERLYLGTLTGAWVFDLRAQSWTQLLDELPAPTVLCVATDDRYVYFGTTNGIARLEKKYLRPGRDK